MGVGVAAAGAVGTGAPNVEKGFCPKGLSTVCSSSACVVSFVVGGPGGDTGAGVTKVVVGLNVYLNVNSAGTGEGPLRVWLPTLPSDVSASFAAEPEVGEAVVTLPPNAGDAGQAGASGDWQMYLLAASTAVEKKEGVPLGAVVVIGGALVAEVVVAAEGTGGDGFGEVGGVDAGESGKGGKSIFFTLRMTESMMNL
jgi:hypothetical protein